MAEKFTQAVATLCIGSAMQEIAELTHPLMAQYAKKIEAQFVVMNERLITADSELPLHYEKYQLRYLLELFERVIFLDTDAFPVPECLSLFDLVPKDALGAYVVSEFTDLHTDGMRQQLAKFPHLEWDGAYFNSGVLVFSRKHRDLFNIEYGQLVAFGEQTQLNLNRLWAGIELYDIGYRYNHTSVPVKAKDSSYILHYPGTDKRKTLREIKKELNRRGLA